jgi:hypothetical protein
MSKVDRLEAELKLAKLIETLEEAREAMHAGRTPEKIATYQKAADKVATARSAFRERFEVQTGPGDAAPKPSTVSVKASQDRP